MITREPQIFDPPANAFAAAGRAIITACQGTGQALLMLLGAAAQTPHLFSRKNRDDVMRQLYLVGIKSLGVVSVVALFTGMILALQVGLELRRYGQENNIGTLVCISMLREMGPFMTGLVIAASVGSAIAAQMGTMTVAEEIAALDTQIAGEGEGTNAQVLRAQRDAAVREYSVSFERYRALSEESAGTLNLTTLERAQPVAVNQSGFTAPQSRTTRALMGAALGVLLGLGVALLAERFDARLRDRRRRGRRSGRRR